jgi:O-antigen/teichoic acid export membrane protein
MKFSVIGEDLVQPAVNLLILILLSLIGLKIGGVIISTAISHGFALLLLLFFVKNLFSDELDAPFSSNFAFRKLFIFSISTGLAGIFTLLTGWLSRLFIGYYRPAAEAGIYQAASQISIIFVMILSSLNAIFAPMIADLYNKNELSRINELYKISTKWGLYVILPFFIVICFIPKDFIVAVFGENYLDGWLPLVILATSQVVNVATGAVGFLLIMTGHQYHWFRISFVTMLTNIVLNIILVPRFGMVGTALATALSLGGLFVIGLIQTKRVLGLWPYDRRYLKGLVSTGFATVLLILINPFISNYPPYAVVLICTVISYGSFWLGLLLLGIDNEDKELVRVFTTRLRNPGFLSSD